MSLDEFLVIVAGIPLFAEMENDARKSLIHSMQISTLQAVDVLFHKGENSDGGYIVLSGAVALGRDASRASAEKIVGPRSLIGEIALVSRTERPVTAVAHETTSVSMVSRVSFHKVLREYPQSAFRVRAYISNRLKRFAVELATAKRDLFDDLTAIDQASVNTTGT